MIQLDVVVGTTCRLVATTAKDDPDNEDREYEDHDQQNSKSDRQSDDQRKML